MKRSRQIVEKKIHTVLLGDSKTLPAVFELAQKAENDQELLDSLPNYPKNDSEMIETTNNE